MAFYSAEINQWDCVSCIGSIIRRSTQEVGEQPSSIKMAGLRRSPLLLYKTKVLQRKAIKESILSTYCSQVYIIVPIALIQRVSREYFLLSFFLPSFHSFFLYSSCYFIFFYQYNRVHPI